jgi:hypothetical protein
MKFLFVKKYSLKSLYLLSSSYMRNLKHARQVYKVKIYVKKIYVVFETGSGAEYETN